MAIAPLNEFKSVPVAVTTTPTIIYTTPIALSTIVLKIQAANVSLTPDFVAKLTCKHVRDGQRTHIVLNAPIPPNDLLIVDEGKLVLEEGDSIEVSAETDGAVELIMSYLETSA